MTLFLDPVAQVKFSDPYSDKVWLFTLPDNPYINGLTINYDKGGKIAGFSFSVDMPYEAGIKSMEYPSPFMLHNVVNARIGYASDGIWLPWVGGFLSNGGAGLSVDANGVSGTVEVQAVAESYGFTIDMSSIRECGRNPDHVLRKLGTAMGLKTVISDGAKEEMAKWGRSLEQNTPSPIVEAQAFFSEMAPMSNWEGIKFICRKWNLSFWIGHDIGVVDNGRNLFISTNAEVSKGVGQDSHTKTYVVRGAIDESKLQYPCLSWSPEGSSVADWLANQPDPSAHGVTASGISEGSGELMEASASPREQPVAIHGVSTADEPEDREDAKSGIVGEISKNDGSLGDHLSIPVQDGSEEELKKAAEEKQMNGNPALTGTITTLGIPDERPGNPCRLQGAGSIYNGPFVVERVTHTYAPGSWEMTLTVRREGTTAKVGSQDETREGQMKQ